jgi:N-acetylgalactosamine-6-sulfatase
MAFGFLGSHSLLQAALAQSSRATTSQAGSPRHTGRPNFVFILCDDLGWGDLGCYGHPHIKTPNLDRLAAQGTLYTQFYVSSGVCSPSRAAFMTSHFPARHRIHGHLATPEQNEARGMPDWLDARVPTVTRLLQSAGYATAHFGKWHLGGGPGAPDPGAYGIGDHRSVNSNGPGWEDEQDAYFRARSTRLIVDETIRFIEANRDSPFYVNVWTLLPHALLHPTDEQMAPYRQFAPGGTKFPYKGAMQIYYASVSDIDEQVGRLMNKLDELGLADNTVVFFSSDNGPEDIHIRNASHSGVGSPGPFRGRKRSLYEGGVRMPWIVRWPGHIPARRVDDVTVMGAVDFLPTVCSMAAVAVPDDLAPDGEDRSAALVGNAKQRTRPLMWEWRFIVHGDTLNRSPMLAIRDGKWKLLMNPDRSRVELYDIPNDPSELNNRAKRHPDVVTRLSKRVLAWQATLPEGPLQPGAGSNAYPWPRGSPDG